MYRFYVVNHHSVSESLGSRVKGRDSDVPLSTVHSEGVEGKGAHSAKHIWGEVPLANSKKLA